MQPFLHWLLFTAGMALLVEPSRCVISAAALLVACARPSLRWPALAVASVAIWFSRFDLWAFPGVGGPGFRLAAQAGVVALAYLLAYLCLRAQGRFRLWALLPFGFFFVILALEGSLRGSGQAFAFFWMLGVVFNAFLWPTTITGLHPSAKERFSTLRTTFLLLPFWQFLTAMPVPASPSFLLEKEARTDAELAATRRAGLGLLAHCLAFTVVLRLFSHWAFGEALFPFSPRPFFLKGTFDSFLSLHGPGALPWLGAMVAPVVKLLLFFSVEVGLSVAIARMMGFDLPKMVHRPFLSSSFNHFLGSILHYYNQILLKGVFPLARRSVPGFVPARHRLSATVFLSVWLGGFAFHILRDLPLGLRDRPALEFVASYVHVMPYYFLLGLVAAAGAATRHRASEPGVPARLLLSLGYLVIYSFLFSFDLLARHDEKSWAEIWNAWTAWR